MKSRARRPSTSACAAITFALPRGCAARVLAVEGHRRATDDRARVEREQRILREPLAEQLQHACGLEDRHRRRYHRGRSGRVTALRRDLQRPAGGSAARNDRQTRIARAVLEADGDIGGVGQRPQCVPRKLSRLAESSSSPVMMTTDPRIVQGAGGMQGLERVDDDHVPALHVDDAGPARFGGARSARIAGTGVRVEHGVQMTDEQHVRAAPGMFRDQVPGPFERGAVHPACAEPERVELRPEPVADRAHAGQVRVPLLMLTTASSRATAASFSRSTAATMRCSTESSGGERISVHGHHHAR